MSFVKPYCLNNKKLTYMKRRPSNFKDAIINLLSRFRIAIKIWIYIEALMASICEVAILFNSIVPIKIPGLPFFKASPNYIYVRPFD